MARQLPALQDESKRHELVRTDVREVLCALCDLRQPVGTRCARCKVAFGEYVCLLCNFFEDDLSKGASESCACPHVMGHAGTHYAARRPVPLRALRHLPRGGQGEVLPLPQMRLLLRQVLEGWPCVSSSAEVTSPDPLRDAGQTQLHRGQHAARLRCVLGVPVQHHKAHLCAQVWPHDTHPLPEGA